jgi:hypoxanthine phosphoribosyltransferase
MEDTISKVQKPINIIEYKIGWSEYLKNIDILKEKIQNNILEFDNIYPIPRGGLIIATVLSYKLNKPIILKEEEINEKTLIVDDLIDSGKTIKELLVRTNTKNPKIAMMYKSEACEGFQKIPLYHIDYTQKNEWIIFPYE